MLSGVTTWSFVRAISRAGWPAGASRTTASLRETFTLPRDKARARARDFLDRYPKAAYMSSVESWRNCPVATSNSRCAGLPARIRQLQLQTGIWNQHIGFCRIPITRYSGIPPKDFPRAGEIMARDRKDLGARKFVRVDLRKKGFLIPAPDAPRIECCILDISRTTAPAWMWATSRFPRCSAFPSPRGGEVRRVCALIWRRGEFGRCPLHLRLELRKGTAPAG